MPPPPPGVPVVLERRRYGADAVVASAQAVILSINAVSLIERMQRDPRVANAMNRPLLAQVRLLHGKIDVEEERRGLHPPRPNRPAQHRRAAPVGRRLT